MSDKVHEGPYASTRLVQGVTWIVDLYQRRSTLRSCRLSCRLNPTLSGIAKGKQRQITLSVNDLQVNCRTSYPLRSPDKRNTLWGIRYGGIFGLLYSAWAIVIFLVGGQEAFARRGTTVGEVIVLYLAGGAIASAIVGMLRPLMYHRPGAALVCFLSVVPLAFGTKVMLSGLQH